MSIDREKNLYISSLSRLNYIWKIFSDMKGKDLRNIVSLNNSKGDGRTKIFRDLAGGLSLETIKRLCKMIDTTCSIDLAYPSGRPCIVRTPGAIGKVKTWANANGRVSVRKLHLPDKHPQNLEGRS